MADNLKLWNSVEPTHPKYTKAFKRGGGFKGTAINPTYLIKKATEIWGPMGGKWAFEMVNEQYVDGAPLMDAKNEVIGKEIIHVFYGRLRHPDGEVFQYGQTTFVGKNKFGPFTDEEAPKKSYTDSLNKCLSQLGFSADIFLGMWDDSKYVNDRKEAVRKEAAGKADNSAPPKEPEDVVAEAVDTVDAAVEERWTTWEKNMGEMVAAVNTDEELMTLKANVRSNFEECPEKDIRKRVAMVFANKGAAIAERDEA